MKVIIEIIEEEECLTLIPETEKEKKYLINLWHIYPDILLEKRGCITGTIPIKDHKFTIAIIKKLGYIVL